MQNALSIGNLTLDSRVVLAPMSGYTDLIFRRLLRALGGLGLAYTEMINPKSVLHGGGRKRRAILATAPDDRPLGVQIYGADPGLMAEAAQWLAEKGAALIDINMGCPQKKIAQRGAGAALLKSPGNALAVARRVIGAVKTPVTAKLRLGWDDAAVASRLAPELEQAGIAAITVHGRTGLQQYAGQADWRAIATVVRSVAAIPVIGNGDIDSPQAARALLAETGCAGIMIGRAALKYPWLIRNIARLLQTGQPAGAPAFTERRAFMQAHFEAMALQHGERIGVLLFRRWIPQYARGLRLDRPTMIRLLQTAQADALRRQLRELAPSGLDNPARLDAPGADLADDGTAVFQDADFLEVGKKFPPGNAGGMQPDPPLGLGQTMMGHDIAGE